MSTILKTRSNTNISEKGRWLSLMGGAGLIGYGMARRDKTGAGLAALGGAFAYWGVSGHCHLFQVLGVNTAASDRPGVPYELGIRVDEEVHINKPVANLYRFWRNLENLPKFMVHLDCVRETSDTVSHWSACGPAGMTVEWDAEIVNDIENEVIGWRSLPGSQVDNGGSVRFEPVDENSSIVKISLQYNPPAGSLGALVARIFGEDPRQTIRQDLGRFKELMETGTLSSYSAAPAKDARWKTRRQKGDNDNVESSSEESFPASDAPSWTPETL